MRSVREEGALISVGDELCTKPDLASEARVDRSVPFRRTSKVTVRLLHPGSREVTVEELRTSTTVTLPLSAFLTPILTGRLSPPKSDFALRSAPVRGDLTLMLNCIAIGASALLSPNDLHLFDEALRRHSLETVSGGGTMLNAACSAAEQCTDWRLIAAFGVRMRRCAVGAKTARARPQPQRAGSRADHSVAACVQTVRRVFHGALPEDYE